MIFFNKTRFTINSVLHSLVDHQPHFTSSPFMGDIYFFNPYFNSLFPTTFPATSLLCHSSTLVPASQILSSCIHPKLCTHLSQSFSPQDVVLPTSLSHFQKVLLHFQKVYCYVCYKINQSMHERWVGLLSMDNKKIHSFMTRNNQQSFHVLTIFEHHTTYNVRNGLVTFS